VSTSREAVLGILSDGKPRASRELVEITRIILSPEVAACARILNIVAQFPKLRKWTRMQE